MKKPRGLDLRLQSDNPQYSLSPRAGGDEFGVVTQKTIQFEDEARHDRRLHPNNRPVPQVHLSAIRFAASTLLLIAVLVGVLVLFVHGIVIDKDVLDDLGSSKEASNRVELYQTINGYVTAVIGDVLQTGLQPFLAIALTFLANVKLFPGDDTSVETKRHKKFLLWAFRSGLIFVLNVAISAAYVSHKTTRVVRVFLPADLVAVNSLSLNKADATIGNGVSVFDTILRTGVQRKAVPFQFKPDSQCSLSHAGNMLSDQELQLAGSLPSVKDVRSTAAVYGFPTQEWNMDVMPYGLKPQHSVAFNSGNVNATRKELNDQFQSFQTQANVSWLTMYELLLQGKLMFERSVSNANSSATYPCVDSDGRQDLEPKNGTAAPTDGLDRFEEGDNAGMRRCFGARSSLSDLQSMGDPKMHSVEVFVDTITAGIIKTVDAIEPEEMNLTLETYEINAQMKLTAMTIDIPYLTNTSYRDVGSYCDSNFELLPEVAAEVFDNTTTAEDKEATRSLLCDQRNYPYDDPRATCGHDNCVFLDKSETVTFKKQLELMPYLKNCDTINMTYDDDFLNFFPQRCQPQEKTVFLYGLGSYMSGEGFDSGAETGMPFIANPRRHVVLTFAKLEWEYIDLNSKFDAACHSNATGACAGLLYSLKNATSQSTIAKSKDKYERSLVLGKSSLPAELATSDFRNPVQLVTLNSKKFYYTDEDEYYEWEYLDKTRFGEVIWPAKGLNASLCSPLIDSYLEQIEVNHYYMGEPLQPLYTSALLYLFQDAAVKSVKLAQNKSSKSPQLLGTTSLHGDQEKHEIKFSLPLLSLISTFIGLGILVLLALLVIVRPMDRLERSEEDTTVVAQFASLLRDDKYPEEVYDRGLLLPGGERVAFDEYTVESISFHHVRDEDTKIYL